MTELLPGPGMRVLEARPDVRVLVLPAPTEAELARALPEADGVVMVMEQPALTARLIELAPRLRVACRFGAGYDNVDVPALTRRGIPLATTGDANASTVAEHALYLMLALAKRGPARERMKPGAFLVNVARGPIVDEVALAGPDRRFERACVFNREALGPESKSDLSGPDSSVA